MESEFPVLPIFIFDTDILDQLEDKKDRRVDYIHQALNAINSLLKKYDSKLRIYHGKPMEIFSALSEEYDIEAVFCNRDYEPGAIEKDKEIYYFLRKKISHSKPIKIRLFLIKMIFFKKTDLLIPFIHRLPRSGEKH